MSVDEFCQVIDRILVERAHTLKEFQVFDCRLYKDIVRRAGRVTELDEYYLTFVGVPPTGYLKRPVKRVGAKMNAKPQRLF
jgi:hypothetical protein